MKFNSQNLYRTS